MQALYFQSEDLKKKETTEKLSRALVVSGSSYLRTLLPNWIEFAFHLK